MQKSMHFLKSCRRGLFVALTDSIRLHHVSLAARKLTKYTDKNLKS